MTSLFYNYFSESALTYTHIHAACEFAGFLQIVVDAINQLVNDCSECNDPDCKRFSDIICRVELFVSYLFHLFYDAHQLQNLP